MKCEHELEIVEVQLFVADFSLRTLYMHLHMWSETYPSVQFEPISSPSQMIFNVI